MRRGIAVVVACVLAARVDGARVDRVGMKDVLLEHIGDVRACAASSARLLTLASADAIAVVRVDDGRAVWRVTREEGEWMELAATRADGSAGVVASGARRGASAVSMRAIDGNDRGTMVWEDAQGRMTWTGDGRARTDSDEAGGRTLALAGGEVVERNWKSGETAWRVNLGDRLGEMNVTWERAFYGRCSKGSARDDGFSCAYALGRDALGTPCAAEMDAREGGVLGAKCAAGKWVLARDSPFVVDREVGSAKTPRAIATTRDGGAVTVDVVALATRGKGISTTNFGANAVVESIEDLRGVEVRSREVNLALGLFAVRFRDGSSAVAKTNGNTGGVEVIASFGNEDGVRTTFSPATSRGDNEHAVVVVVRSHGLGDGMFRYERISVATKDGSLRRLGTTVRGDRLKRAAPLARAFAVPQGDSWASVLVDEDATISYHEGQVVKWTREEASSQAEDVMFGSLPADEPIDGAAGASESLSLRERLELQLLSLKARFHRASKSDMTHLSELRSRVGAKNLAQRDVNGFRKSLLALSPRGSLVALHNGDGRTMWKQYFGAKNYGTFARLRPWKPIGADRRAEYALALATTSNSSTFIVINQYNGDVFGEPTTIPTRAAHVLPFTTSTGEDAVIVVDSEGHAETYPASARSEAEASLDYVSYYTVDRTANEVRGYKIISSEKGTLDSLHSWTVAFPPDAGEIVGFAAKPESGERVHSWTRIPGDRSTLFKYLNPNVAFLATSDGNSIRVTLIDGVTGRILYRVRHGDARGPVRAVVYENWVSYHYFNTRAKRYAMSVLEMFDDSDEKRSLDVKTLVYDAVLGRSRNETLSAYAPPPLRVIGQSYFVRPEAKFLAVTRSARGITEPAILLGTGTDQVVALEKRFLDPRRPTKPTAADAEEGLVPYAEVIPIFPHSWVTQRHVIRGLRGVVTAPAELESNVHVLAHGLDVFYARITPSASFDALDDDFNFALLLGTLVALFLGVIALKRAADAAEENKNWR